MQPIARTFAILGLVALVPVLVFAAGRGGAIVLLSAVSVVLIAASLHIMFREDTATAA